MKTSETLSKPILALILTLRFFHTPKIQNLKFFNEIQNLFPNSLNQLNDLISIFKARNNQNHITSNPKLVSDFFKYTAVRLSPKSASFTVRKQRLTRMFAGFKSRWM